MSFTQAELDYLGSQVLGRLATVAPDGTPQVSPTGFRYNAELGTIDIGGHNMARSKKFRNVAAGSRAAFVVDDIESTKPWKVRGVEVRGDAEALTGATAPAGLPGTPGEIIRIHPRRIVSWGLGESEPYRVNARSVASSRSVKTRNRRR
ncbi:MAG TPA: PPOX class F420-dependent oxidoreductase [Actinophytocola sp.]|uniref:PPOX class F420-dependent oxidoreductase n=1 Tax=Actinophytocola sp. TaxID=1872138 RepID=UPI002DDD66B0|nr:PPOX class F420-dependent oxidoreductase [Actinophytocola sp.]HEV2779628.1 PPOX class F420-dependent oxidoreductase [Actinophytocola sp.]